MPDNTPFASKYQMFNWVRDAWRRRNSTKMQEFVTKLNATDTDSTRSDLDLQERD